MGPGHPPQTLGLATEVRLERRGIDKGFSHSCLRSHFYSSVTPLVQFLCPSGLQPDLPPKPERSRIKLEEGTTAPMWFLTHQAQPGLRPGQPFGKLWGAR